MNGIPERGYGTWAQWRRRVQATKPRGFVFFITGTTSQAEIDAWVRVHTAVPMRDGTKQEAIEVQVP